MRILLKVLGVFFVGLGMLGAALPLLPTTPFILLALACFAKSSPKFQRQLLNHKTFGPLIYNWQQHKAVTRKTKQIAFISLIISAGISCWMLESWEYQVGVMAVLCIPAIILYRLPTLPAVEN